MTRIAQFSEFGPPSAISVVEVDPPEPPAGKVRIRVRAAAINPFDTKVRNGSTQRQDQPAKLPGRLGREVAGVVDALGDGVDDLAVGDEVFGIVAGVGLAELVITNPANLAKRPPELPWEVAGGLSLAGLTAWEAFHAVPVTAADTVLVSAAAGGVGTIVAQLAVLAGATVIGTASESNHDYLRSIGVIPLAYGPFLADRVREVAPRRITAVFDQHGAETIQAGIDLGVDRSRINTTAGNAAAFDVQGVGRGPINTETLTTLADLVVSGRLVVPIEATYPLDDVVEAFERLEAGHLRGKIVIVPEAAPASSASA